LAFPNIDEQDKRDVPLGAIPSHASYWIGISKQKRLESSIPFIPFINVQRRSWQTISHPAFCRFNFLFFIGLMRRQGTTLRPGLRPEEAAPSAQPGNGVQTSVWLRLHRAVFFVVGNDAWSNA
jgi:hypothetical protein